MSTKADHPSDEAYTSAAWFLMCEEAAMRAVGEVEAGSQGAFLDSGEPIVLYEPHIFHRLTSGRFSGIRVEGLPPASNSLSYPAWQPGTYGPVSSQHTKLDAASKLDRDAALMSCSWGLFQILGENYRRAGYSSLQRFINAMYRSADDHLRALVMFIRADDSLVDSIRARRWDAFAREYNGPAFRRNRYDERLAAAYERLAK